MSNEELDDCECTPTYLFVARSSSCVIGLQCEWVKSKARAERWQEEVLLVTEEMRRVLCFLEWKAEWWTAQGSTHIDVSPDVADGILAYSAKQAHINHALAESFRKRWWSKDRHSGDQEAGSSEETESETEEGEDDKVAGSDVDID